VEVFLTFFLFSCYFLGVSSRSNSAGFRCVQQMLLEKCVNAIALHKMMPIVGVASGLKESTGAGDGNLQPPATISLHFNTDEWDVQMTMKP
jgi:hypothetical protein